LAHFRSKATNFAAWLKIPRATVNYGSYWSVHVIETLSVLD